MYDVEGITEKYLELEGNIHGEPTKDTRNTIDRKLREFRLFIVLNIKQGKYNNTKCDARGIKIVLFKYFFRI